MAKFCSKCGTELKEGAKFCPACGAPVKQIQMDYKAQSNAGKTAQSKNKNLWLLAIPAAIIVLLLAVFGVKSVVSPAYLKPVKYLEKAMNKQDTSLLRKAFSDEYQDRTGQAEYMMAALASVDSKYKVSFKVTDKEKLSRRDLEETLMYDYYVSEDDADDATAGYVLDTQMKIKAQGQEMTQDFTIVVAKVDGHWVIVSGI